MSSRGRGPGRMGPAGGGGRVGSARGRGVASGSDYDHEYEGSGPHTGQGRGARGSSSGGGGFGDDYESIGGRRGALSPGRGGVGVGVGGRGSAGPVGHDEAHDGGRGREGPRGRGGRGRGLAGDANGGGVGHDEAYDDGGRASRGRGGRGRGHTGGGGYVDSIEGVGGGGRGDDGSRDATSGRSGRGRSGRGRGFASGFDGGGSGGYYNDDTREGGGGRGGRGSGGGGGRGLSAGGRDEHLDRGQAGRGSGGGAGGRSLAAATRQTALLREAALMMMTEDNSQDAAAAEDQGAWYDMEESDARRVTGMVKVCGTMADLQALVDRWGPGFNQIHISACMCRLPKLVDSRQDAAAAHRLARRLCGLLPHYASELGSRTAANIIWSLGALGTGGGAAAAAADVCLRTFGRALGGVLPLELANVMWALAALWQQGYFDAPAFSGLFPASRIRRAVAACSERLCSLLDPPDFSGVTERDLSEAAWAAAAVGQQLPPDQAYDIFGRLAAPSVVGALPGRYIARALYSGGVLRGLDGWEDPLSPQQWRALAAAFMDRIEKTDGEDLSNYLVGLALLSGADDGAGAGAGDGAGRAGRLRDPAIDPLEAERFASEVIAHITRSPEAAADHHNHHQQQQQQQQQQAAAAPSPFESFDASQAGAALWGCAKMGLHQFAVINALCNVCTRAMASPAGAPTKQALVQLAWALSRFGHGHAALVPRVVQQAVQLARKGHLSAGEKLTAAWLVVVANRRSLQPQLRTLLSSLPLFDDAPEEYPGETLRIIYQAHLWLLDVRKLKGSGGGSCPEAADLPPGLLARARQAWRGTARVRSRQQLQAADGLYGLLESLRPPPRGGSGAPPAGGREEPWGPGGVGRLALHAQAAADHEYAIDVAAELDGRRYAFMLDDPPAFCSPAQGRLNGDTLARNRALAARGWTAVSVPAWEWQALRGDEGRQRALLVRLTARRRSVRTSGAAGQEEAGAAAPHQDDRGEEAAEGAADDAAWHSNSNHQRLQEFDTPPSQQQQQYASQQQQQYASQQQQQYTSQQQYAPRQYSREPPQQQAPPAQGAAARPPRGPPPEASWQPPPQQQQQQQQQQRHAGAQASQQQPQPAGARAPSPASGGGAGGGFTLTLPPPPPLPPLVLQIPEKGGWVPAPHGAPASEPPMHPMLRQGPRPAQQQQQQQVQDLPSEWHDYPEHRAPSPRDRAAWSDPPSAARPPYQQHQQQHHQPYQQQEEPQEPSTDHRDWAPGEAAAPWGPPQQQEYHQHEWQRAPPSEPSLAADPPPGAWPAPRHQPEPAPRAAAAPAPAAAAAPAARAAAGQPPAGSGWHEAEHEGWGDPSPHPGYEDHRDPYSHGGSYAEAYDRDPYGHGGSYAEEHRDPYSHGGSYAEAYDRPAAADAPREGRRAHEGPAPPAPAPGAGPAGPRQGRGAPAPWEGPPTGGRGRGRGGGREGAAGPLGRGSGGGGRQGPAQGRVARAPGGGARPNVALIAQARGLGAARDFAALAEREYDNLDAPNVAYCMAQLTRNLDTLRQDKRGSQRAAELLGERLTGLLDEAGARELSTALWAFGRMSTAGAFAPHWTSAFFEPTLQAFMGRHMATSRLQDVAMAIGAVAYLTKGGFALSTDALRSAVTEGVADRFWESLQDAERRHEVTCQDLGDCLWSMAVIGCPVPHGQLRAMALRASEPGVIADSSAGSISKVLWSLSELQISGAPPPLPPGGPEWQRMCHGFLDRAAEAGADAKSASFYRQAVQRLSSEAGGGGGGAGRCCISKQVAKRCLDEAPPAEDRRRP